MQLCVGAEHLMNDTWRHTNNEEGGDLEKLVLRKVRKTVCLRFQMVTYNLPLLSSFNERYV